MTTIDLALTRWAVACREWSELSANSHPHLPAFLAGWFMCDIGAAQPPTDQLGRFRDSFRRGWKECHNMTVIIERDILERNTTQTSEITNLEICKLPYQEHPFVHGTRDGRDVWLTQDGQWTEEDGAPHTAIPFHQTDPS